MINEADIRATQARKWMDDRTGQLRPPVGLDLHKYFQEEYFCNFDDNIEDEPDLSKEGEQVITLIRKIKEVSKFLRGTEKNDDLALSSLLDDAILEIQKMCTKAESSEPPHCQFDDEIFYEWKDSNNNLGDIGDRHVLLTYDQINVLLIPHKNNGINLLIPHTNKGINSDDADNISNYDEAMKGV